MTDAKSPGVREASTKISKKVRQFVVGSSSLWVGPEKVMGKAVRVKSKRPWDAGDARKTRVARRASLRETPCGLQPSGHITTQPLRDPDARLGAVNI